MNTNFTNFGVTGALEKILFDEQDIAFQTGNTFCNIILAYLFFFIIRSTRKKPMSRAYEAIEKQMIPIVMPVDRPV